MKIALTGATGFVGNALLHHFLSTGHSVQAWFRGDPPSFTHPKLTWVKGSLNCSEATQELLSGTDTLIHAAVYRPSRSNFQADISDLPSYLQTNLMGSILLFETARKRALERVIFFSTCAVHEHILEDRALDENHPCTPSSHYGAHKAALEQFVQSYAHTSSLSICALRPCGVYGLRPVVAETKWYPLIKAIQRGEEVHASHGGKIVHVEDVVKATETLLQSPPEVTSGNIYNCCDRYVSDYDVAVMTHELLESEQRIHGSPKTSKHSIQSSRLEALGFKFQGLQGVRELIRDVLESGQ